MVSDVALLISVRYSPFGGPLVGSLYPYECRYVPTVMGGNLGPDAMVVGKFSGIFLVVEVVGYDIICDGRLAHKRAHYVFT